eukprot:65728-Prorocentrum_minimum.AAC.2
MMMRESGKWPGIQVAEGRVVWSNEPEAGTLGRRVKVIPWALSPSQNAAMERPQSNPGGVGILLESEFRGD